MLFYFLGFFIASVVVIVCHIVFRISVVAFSLLCLLLDTVIAFLVVVILASIILAIHAM